jgi:SAM-dependent methyltransferase
LLWVLGFAEAAVYDAATALEGRTFDVVYTSIGSIIWLPDLTRWASTVTRLLAPGGRFYMAEFHPFSVVLGDEDLMVTDSHFDAGPFLHDEPGSYADPSQRCQLTEFSSSLTAGTSGSG